MTHAADRCREFRHLHQSGCFVIPDSTGDSSNPLVEFTLAVERIHAARRAIDDSGTGILLTGRSEGFIVERPDPFAEINGSFASN